jgi:hypothetical protein
VFISSTVRIEIEGDGAYSVRYAPEVLHAKKTPVLMVTPVDHEGAMQWQRTTEVMGKQFYCGAHIALNDTGLQVLMSAIKPVDPDAAAYWEAESDYIRFVWTGRAKAAVQAVVDSNVVDTLVRVCAKMTEAFADV